MVLQRPIYARFGAWLLLLCFVLSNAVSLWALDRGRFVPTADEQAHWQEQLEWAKDGLDGLKQPWSWTPALGPSAPKICHVVGRANLLLPFALEPGPKPLLGYAGPLSLPPYLRFHALIFYE